MPFDKKPYESVYGRMNKRAFLTAYVMNRRSDDSDPIYLINAAVKAWDHINRVAPENANAGPAEPGHVCGPNCGVEKPDKPFSPPPWRDPRLTCASCDIGGCRGC